jgi:hypothetical protein
MLAVHRQRDSRPALSVMAALLPDLQVRLPATTGACWESCGRSFATLPSVDRRSVGFVGLVLVGCGGSEVEEVPVANADASAACMIVASNYDRSCVSDTDCVAVPSGDYCAVTDECLACPSAAINVGDLARFDADVAKTPIGSDKSPQTLGCSCIQFTGPCCRSGTCQLSCAPRGDSLAACSTAGDAGGQCYLSAKVSCSLEGPPNSCAFSDEVCCLH